VLIALASVGKFLGVFIGGRFGGMTQPVTAPHVGATGWRAPRWWLRFGAAARLRGRGGPRDHRDGGTLASKCVGDSVLFICGEPLARPAG
jgi:hypothetical protein